jgi:hypothetical protein
LVQPRRRRSQRAREFYASLLDWEIGEEGMVAGDGRPWAAIDSTQGGNGSPGWIP